MNRRQGPTAELIFSALLGPGQPKLASCDSVMHHCPKNLRALALDIKAAEEVISSMTAPAAQDALRGLWELNSSRLP